jgi:hypothetical protein
LCFAFFCRIEKTPVGVSCPFFPVETVVIPMATPLR